RRTRAGLAAASAGPRGGPGRGGAAEGFFAGLTNVRPPEGTDLRRRSRGELVVDVLRAGAAGAADLVASRSPADYNPFYLLFGDAAGLRLAASPPGAKSIALSEVAPRFPVLPNGALAIPHFPQLSLVAAPAPSTA